MIKSIEWSTEDVLQCARDINTSLTRKQADMVLEYVIDNHNAEEGICWVTFQNAIDNKVWIQ